MDLVVISGLKNLTCIERNLNNQLINWGMNVKTLFRKDDGSSGIGEQYNQVMSFY